MSQKLIMPMNQSLLNASYKYPEYLTLGIGTHYGTDLGGSTTMYASGIGEVIKEGMDTVLGNTVIIEYDDAYIPQLDKVTSVVVRYMHLASIKVSAGDKVTKDTVIGAMGATGKYVNGAHLHVEVDTDCEYPEYTPTLSRNSSICKAGTDTTLNPMKVFHIKTSAPDNQTLSKNPRTSWQTAGEMEAVPKIESTEYSGKTESVSVTKPVEKEPEKEVKKESKEGSTKYKVGQKVRFSSCYKSSTAKIGFPPIGEAVRPAAGFDTGVITKIYPKTNNPYLINDGQCFTNDGDIRQIL